MKLKYLSLFVVVIALLPPAKVVAALTCGSCHPSLTKVLPASHKGYQNTALCLVCHKTKGKALALGKKVHTIHLEKQGKLDCASCHQPDSTGKVTLSTGDRTDLAAMKALAVTFSSWHNSTSLDRAHKERDLYCTDCHQNYLNGDDSADRCVACHGDYDEMTKRPSSYEKNPHKSHFADLRCTVCHKGHTAFKDSCSSCHPFGYAWTYKKK